MGPSPTYHPPKEEECETLVAWVTSLGKTRRRVLLPATAPFPHGGEPLCWGTCSRAVGG